MKNIPKIAYFYWGNRVMPWMRYMTLFSFRKYNPTWKMCLYTTDRPSNRTTWNSGDHSVEIKSKNYWNEVRRLDVDVVPIDQRVVSSITGSDDTPEVIKSDALRLILLHDHGGLWSDMDIVYIRPVELAFKPNDATACFCKHKLELPNGLPDKKSANYHRIGFLMGAPGNPHFGNLLKVARNSWNPLVYQSLGAGLYKHNVDMGSPDVFNIPMSCVYPYNVVDRMFESTDNGLLGKIRKNTVGWHWYGGNKIAGKYQNIITNENIERLSRSPVVSLLRRVMNE